MEHGLDEKEWVARFAATMRVKEPAIEPSLATEVAKSALSLLYFQNPEDAVITYLAVRREE